MLQISPFSSFFSLLCPLLANSSPVNHEDGARGQSSSCHYLMGAPITSLLLPCRGGKGQEVGRVSDGEETVELELWYIDGIDICSGL